jgi:IS30 family transposase
VFFMSEPKFSSASERSAWRHARRLKYLSYIEGGFNSTHAARLAGVSKRTAKVWRNGRRRRSGRDEAPSLPFYNRGMEPPKQHSRKFFTLKERVEIYRLLMLGHSRREIAKHLGRHHSSVSREIAKNLDFNGGYYPGQAQDNFRLRLPRPKKRKVDGQPGLWVYILRLLELRWSPMQISRHLSQTYPDDASMRLSAESIYQAIYIQGKGRLKEKLRKLMRQGRTGRMPRKGREESAKARFREPMVSISRRPAEANDRAVPGHWEGDLIMGKRNRTAIGTLVERSTRFCILLHLPKDHAADSVQKEVVRKMKNLPEHLKRSLAWDQGAELALHSKISKELDMKIFFCDPHSPWQRGTNENTNGLLRQYFPKGTDLSVHSDEELDHVAAELNGRPRMTLGWKTPAQKFLELQNSNI